MAAAVAGEWSGGSRRLPGTGFAAFDRPGYAKVVWDSQVTPQADGYSMSGTLALA